MDWIIGGTKDSRCFLKSLTEFRENIIVTTISEYGKKLLDEYNLKVIVKPMEENEMLEFVEKYNVKRIFDFTHPYAINVSKNAMKVSNYKNIEYYRFNRKTYEYDNCIEFNRIEELVEFVSNLNGNILSTLGSNNVKKFENLKNLKNIYFRVLPTVNAIEKVENIGVMAKNIIGIQGPFSENFNCTIYNNYNIKYLITKESGDVGGEKEKIESALRDNIKVIILKKPLLDYSWETDNLKIILKKFKENIGE
ncbi:MAG: precorrin-6A reductase [Fusobacterium sp.]